MTLDDYFDIWAVDGRLRELACRPVAHWIDNTAVVAGPEVGVWEPATEDMLTHTFEAGVAIVDQAVSAAKRALEGEWREMRPLDRQAVLLRLAGLLEEHKEELAFLESIDVGKPVTQARDIDVGGSVDVLRYFAGAAVRVEGRSSALSAYGEGKFGITFREPVGVVAAVSPWNFPLQTLVWKCAAAFAAGCTVVAKPSQVTPLSTLRFGELCAEAGFPRGVFNAVNGTGRITGEALISHAGINKITFTGATSTGISVGQAALPNLPRLTLELGGKSPAIVTADADIVKAVTGVINGIFFNSGQVCDATSRVVVARDIYDKFMESLITAVSDLRIGCGLDPATFMGPLASFQHKAKVRTFVEKARSDGLKLVLDRGDHDGRGWYVGPVIATDVPAAHPLWREEIFGPVLSVRCASREKDLVELANDSEFALGASIYSSNIDTVTRLARRVRAGTIYVNGHGFLDPGFPFGGLLKSGFGKDLGPDQLESYLETKSVLFG